MVAFLSCPFLSEFRLGRCFWWAKIEDIVQSR
jgi:hypothetical protein